jgi:hypothetical protein
VSRRGLEAREAIVTDGLDGSSVVGGGLAAATAEVFSGGLSEVLAAGVLDFSDVDHPLANVFWTRRTASASSRHP